MKYTMASKVFCPYCAAENVDRDGSKRNEEVQCVSCRKWFQVETYAPSKISYSTEGDCAKNLDLPHVVYATEMRYNSEYTDFRCLKCFQQFSCRVIEKAEGDVATFKILEPEAVEPVPAKPIPNVISRWFKGGA